MTATVHSTTTHPHGRLLRTGAFAGVAASVATVAIAAFARAAGAVLEVDDKSIPLVAFAFWTIVATAAGVAIAAIVRRRRPFIAITLAATALSLIPAVIAPDDTSVSVVLVGTHLAAAAIVIPALGRQLSLGSVQMSEPRRRFRRLR